MTWLLDYFDEYIQHARTTSTNLISTDTNAVPENDKLKIATLELRTLLERFANNTSMDIIFDAIDVLVNDTRRDPELRQWFKNIDTSRSNQLVFVPSFKRPSLEVAFDTAEGRVRCEVAVVRLCRRRGAGDEYGQGACDGWEKKAPSPLMARSSRISGIPFQAIV
ncbi:hypothetical protein FA13DRAFT_1466724 [Coprinellus micaceus]|uniref:HAM1-like N-terminal domain-containing protein n=1 Tax=Coprinellus micaceus TaxID=71717 RepID=A0A4Y7SLR1_COPMI|nr:hypothetical protein FA13DRAFT_1466724 [Coprinellus micaceus]